MVKYESHCEPSKISALSRCAIKVKDNFYTIEASMEKNVLTTEDIDMEKEYQILFDELNSITDAQCADIIDTFRK